MKRLTLISCLTLAINFSLFAQFRPNSFNGPYVNSLSNRVYLDYTFGPRKPVADPATTPGVSSITIFPGNTGDPITNQLAAAWNFNEQFFGATNRFSDMGGLVLTNVGGKTGSLRSLSGGATGLTNSGAGYYIITNDTIFVPSGSFTLAFWTTGGNSGSDPCSMGNIVNNANADWYWDGTSFNAFDNGNNLRIATGTATSGSAWMFTVCGFDSTNNQIFISNNGGARVNAACTSIRHTAKIPFKIDNNPMVFDNLIVYTNRVLQTADITRLYNNGFPIEYPFQDTNYGSVVVHSFNWACVAAGTTNTSVAHSNAIVGLVTNMVAQGLWSKTPYILALGGTTLKDALTPIKGVWGIDGGNDHMFFSPSGMNVNFVDSDVSINGMKGDGSTKYLNISADFRVGLSSFAPSYNSAAQTIYMYTAGIEAGKFVAGGYDDFAVPNNGIFMTAGYSGVGEGGTFGTGASQVFTNTAVPGYMTLTRVNSTELDVYIGQALVPHGLYAQGTTANSMSAPAFNLGETLFAISERNAGVQGLTTNTISYWSYQPQSMSAADSLAYFGFIEDYLTRKGGGAASPFTTDITNSIVLFGNNKTLYVAAGGSPTYQWQKNGTNIANATTSSYTITGASSSDFANYQCVATVGGRPYLSSQIQLATVTTVLVSNWVFQCAVNGAATLSSNTIWGVDQFWNGCVTDGNGSKILMLNLYVPDSLTAALTPLVPGSANKLWVNHNFVAGDLTVNGLTGNGSTKYLETGFNPATMYASSQNSGDSVYFYAASTNSTTQFDYGTGGVGPTFYWVFYVGNAIHSSGLNSGSFNQTAYPNCPTSGYFFNNRVSSTDHKQYYARSNVAFGQVGATDTLSFTTTFASLGAYVFTVNDNATHAFYSPNTHSALEFHQNMVSADGANLFGRLQTVRTVFGGGFR